MPVSCLLINTKNAAGTEKKGKQFLSHDISGNRRVVRAERFRKHKSVLGVAAERRSGYLPDRTSSSR